MSSFFFPTVKLLYIQTHKTATKFLYIWTWNCHLHSSQSWNTTLYLSSSQTWASGLFLQYNTESIVHAPISGKMFFLRSLCRTLQTDLQSDDLTMCFNLCSNMGPFHLRRHCRAVWRTCPPSVFSSCCSLFLLVVLLSVQKTAPHIHSGLPLTFQLTHSSASHIITDLWYIEVFIKGLRVYEKKINQLLWTYILIWITLDLNCAPKTLIVHNQIIMNETAVLLST